MNENVLSSCNHENDCISRQAAIDTLDGEIEITGRTNAEAVKGYVRLVKDRLERLPSAQPDLSSYSDKLCKNLQAHERSLWICPKCIDNFNQKLSVINERNLTQPKPCPYCGGNAIRKQCHFKVGDGESRYKNEHHEDGSLKWTWLECDSCGRATEAYCYEYQATDCWNKGKAERREE